MNAFRLPPSRVLAALLAVAVSWSPATRAAAFTWDGGSASSGNWNDGDNWAGNAAPPSSLDTGIFFNSASPRIFSNQNIAGTFSLNTLSFSASSNHDTISGQTLNFRNDTFFSPPLVLQNSATDVTINNPIVLTNGLSTGGNGAGSLTFAGVVSGAGNIRKAEGFTLILGNANTYSGGTILAPGITGGGIGVGHDNALGSGPLTVQGNRPLFAVGPIEP